MVEHRLRGGRTDPMMTLNAPRGVTSIGGANVYAAKLATGGSCWMSDGGHGERFTHFLPESLEPQPSTVRNSPARRTTDNKLLTCRYPCPPNRVSEVCIVLGGL